MIERVRNPKDRRTINIFLTDRARAMKAELMPVAIEVNDVATTGLSDEEFTQLRALLQKVRENLSAAAQD
jgi:DNA-binding MarR family transcriptional regulator